MSEYMQLKEKYAKKKGLKVDKSRLKDCDKPKTNNVRKSSDDKGTDMPEYISNG